MAEDNSPSLAEIAGAHVDAYTSMYKSVDPDESCTIGPAVAVSFMTKSGLAKSILGQIWDIADHDKSGSLDKNGFFVALKLIAAAQQGVDLTQDAITQPLDPPVIDGFEPPTATSTTPTPTPVAAVTTPDAASVRSATPVKVEAPAQNVWMISESDQAKYIAIYNSLEPVDGKLDGNKVKPVLINSGLPKETLGKIWDLSDLNKDGYLDEDEMCIALYLVYRALEGEKVPPILPAMLIPPGKRVRRLSGNRSSASTPGPTITDRIDRRTSLPVGELADLNMTTSASLLRGSTGAISKLAGAGPPSESGSVHSATPPPRPPPAKPPPPTPPGGTASPAGASTPSKAPSSKRTSSHAVGWAVDVSKFSAQFHSLDTNNDGLVDGGDVKGVFMQSGVPPPILAHIWGLVDIKQTGRLNEEQFALAMQMVHDKKNGKDPPATLPDELVPPSMRSEKEPEDTTGQIENLTADLETLNNDKREVEQAIMELEASMAIKQSENKNLEVEATTLDSTVKQLENQKGLADRRLHDLDLQREALERTLAEMKQLLSKDQQDIEQMSKETENMQLSAKEQEEQLNQKRTDLQNIREEEKRVEVTLQNDRARLDTVVEGYGQVERNIRETEFSVSQLRDHTVTLQSQLEALESIMNSNDLQQLYDRQHELLGAVQQFTVDSTVEEAMNAAAATTNGMPISTSQHSVKSTASVNSAGGGKLKSPPTELQQTNAFAANEAFPAEDAFTANGTASDPFADRDPFADDAGGGEAQPDPFANAEPDDPFGAQAPDDPFADSTGTKANDPFASAPTSDWSTGATSSPKKAPPGRPAPPPTKNDDPFGSSANDPFNDAAKPVNAGGDNFANFADFGAFS